MFTSLPSCLGFCFPINLLVPPKFNGGHWQIQQHFKFVHLAFSIKNSYELANKDSYFHQSMIDCLSMISLVAIPCIKIKKELKKKIKFKMFLCQLKVESWFLKLPKEGWINSSIFKPKNFIFYYYKFFWLIKDLEIRIKFNLTIDT